MKVAVALSMALVANSTMFHETKYNGGTCAGTAIDMKWEVADVCQNFPSIGYMKRTCNGNNVVFTGYSDAACTTVNTSFALPGLTISAGVFNPGTACIFTTGSSSSEKWSCANQPAQVTINFFSDAACSVSTDQPYGMSSYKQALDVCEYETDGGTTKSEIRTISDGTMNTKEYLSSDCTGTKESDSDMLLTNCTYMATNLYGMQASAPVTATQAQAQVTSAPTASSTGATASDASSMAASLLVVAASAAALKLQF
jgi:hypothetical protein